MEMSSLRAGNNASNVPSSLASSVAAVGGAASSGFSTTRCGGCAAAGRPRTNRWGVAPEIEADRSQVGQVVMNLVTNALEALDGHGTISVQVRVEQLDADRLATFQHHQTARPGSFVVFQVEDSGPGIDPTMMARIFEPFFSTKFAGRGLGLASVLGIMHSHRGAVRAQTELGVGASFEVAFPVTARPQSTVPPPEPVEQPWRGSGSVLLVDDDNGVRTIVAKLLKELGFDVTAAEGGQVGLDLFVRRSAAFKARRARLDHARFLR